MCDDLEQPPSLAIVAPEGSTEKKIGQPWSLIAYNKKIVKAWERSARLFLRMQSAATEWLIEHPKEKIPGRCFELKYKQYAGIWCFEIGSGHRVYYKPREDQRDVLIYYAGPHPTKIPYPPKDI